MSTLRGTCLALALLSSLCLIACGGGGSAGTPAPHGSGTVNLDPPDHPGGTGGTDDPPLDEIARQQEMWESQGLANYDFTLQRHSFSPPPLVDAVAMQVRGGQVVSWIYVNTGLPANPPSPEWWPTIDGLFDFLRAAQDGGADSIAVQYDAQRGHPTHASVDYITGAADEEQGFTVANLIPR